MKIAICEDEKETALRLKAMMEASEREITLYFDAESLLADWTGGVRFDVVVTDIVMEEGPAGMELCRRLGEEQVLLIIVTNYLEYAPEGYEYGVFRYLMKPVTQDVLDRTLADVVGELERKAQSSGKFLVAAFDGDRVISGRNIVYVEVHGRYLNIWLCEEQGAEKRILLMQSLKEFASNLPKGKFARVNRNQLVNLERVTLVKPGSVAMDNGDVLSVSRRQQRELQEALARCLA